MKILKFKKAFTLAELLVSMAVLSILAAVLIPTVAQIRPDKNKVLFKKAYSVFERVVADVVNDADLYPNEEETPGLMDQTEVKIAGTAYSGDSKFCEIFASQVNTSSNIECTNSTNRIYPSVSPAADTEGSFTTTDGVMWYFPIKQYSDALKTQDYYLDVNGVDKPNCFYDADKCKSPDRFTMTLRYDGKIIIAGDKEKEYLNSNSTVQQKK